MKNSILILVILSLGVLQSYSQTSDSLKKPIDKVTASDNAHNVKEISRETLLSSNSMEELLSTDCHITSFKLTVLETKGAVRKFSNENGDLLTPAMRDEIKSVRSGSVVAFEFIKCLDKNNDTRKLEPQLFRIK